MRMLRSNSTQASMNKVTASPPSVRVTGNRSRKSHRDLGPFVQLRPPIWQWSNVRVAKTAGDRQKLPVTDSDEDRRRLAGPAGSRDLVLNR